MRQGKEVEMGRDRRNRRERQKEGRTTKRRPREEGERSPGQARVSLVISMRIKRPFKLTF